MPLLSSWNLLTFSSASVETRTVLDSKEARPVESAEGVDNDEDDGDPLMMEMRPRIKASSPSVSLSQRGDMLPPNVSFVSHSFSAIGDKVKELNDTLAELQTLGIQQDVNNLPELVLVGDQSTGKSSLMSAFSGICLPQAEGTCTRCPTHIRLSQNPRWHCKISLQEEYKYEPPTASGRNPGPKVSKAQPYGPWNRQAARGEGLRGLRQIRP